MALPVNPSKRSLQRFLFGRILRHPHETGPITVACMPGESCWDIQFFLQYDRVQRIIAIERDPEVAAVIREKVGDDDRVEVFEGSTTKFLGTTSERFDLLYLDYYSNLNLSVMTDLRLVFRRCLLNEKAKCVVTFLGARESESDQAAQQALFEDLDAYHPTGEAWDTIEAHRRRCLAFTGLVAQYRWTPVRAAKPGDRIYAATCAPKWFSYPTAETGVSMLVGYFTLRKYHSPNPGVGTIHYSPDNWLLRGKNVIQRWERKNFSGMAMVEGPGFVREVWKRRILDFYEKNHYTPGVKEIGRGYIRDWTALVREAGLCPRSGATIEDIKAEVQRIYDRKGSVSWTDLYRAKLAKRSALRTYSTDSKTALGRLLDEMGLLHQVRSKGRMAEDFRIIGLLEEWIDHLDAGKPRTTFPHYGSVRDRGFTNYAKAARELRRLRKKWEGLSEVDRPQTVFIPEDRSYRESQRGMKWITNGTENRRVCEEEIPALGPEWRLGMARKLSSVRMRWITNGSENRRVPEEEVPSLGPEWRLGRTSSPAAPSP
jgi:hypothetical protein